MSIREVELDHAFAEHLATTTSFQQWLLKRTRFSRFADDAVLLNHLQGSVRTASHWWKHWWIRLSDGTESETDIFAVFEAGSATRFALHIENKPPHGKLLMKQAADYRRRAIQMAGKERYLDYHDFATILLAPRSLVARNLNCAEQFDTTIFYEEVAESIPLFSQALG